MANSNYDMYQIDNTYSYYNYYYYYDPYYCNLVNYYAGTRAGGGLMASLELPWVSSPSFSTSAPPWDPYSYNNYTGMRRMQLLQDYQYWPYQYWQYQCIPMPNHRNSIAFKIMKQIDYYFSCENLPSDVFLRRHMDANGWVSVHLIATFRRVKQLTNSITYIIHALQRSEIVEVEGDKVRCRYNWSRWILPHLPHGHDDTCPYAPN